MWASLYPESSPAFHCEWDWRGGEIRLQVTSHRCPSPNLEPRPSLRSAGNRYGRTPFRTANAWNINYRVIYGRQTPPLFERTSWQHWPGVYNWCFCWFRFYVSATLLPPRLDAWTPLLLLFLPSTTLWTLISIQVEWGITRSPVHDGGKCCQSCQQLKLRENLQIWPHCSTPTSRVQIV